MTLPIQTRKHSTKADVTKVYYGSMLAGYVTRNDKWVVARGGRGSRIEWHAKSVVNNYFGVHDTRRAAVEAIAKAAQYTLDAEKAA